MKEKSITNFPYIKNKLDKWFPQEGKMLQGCFSELFSEQAVMLHDHKITSR